MHTLSNSDGESLTLCQRHIEACIPLLEGESIQLAEATRCEQCGHDAQAIRQLPLEEISWAKVAAQGPELVAELARLGYRPAG